MIQHTGDGDMILFAFCSASSEVFGANFNKFGVFERSQRSDDIEKVTV
jgi:hypothetical protein